MIFPFRPSDFEYYLCGFLCKVILKSFLSSMPHVPLIALTWWKMEEQLSDQEKDLKSVLLSKSEMYENLAKMLEEMSESGLESESNACRMCCTP